MKSKGLKTSGVRWGISCEVGNEALMGAMLGYMTMLGAENIAWAPIGQEKKRKDPGAVARGKLGAKARLAKLAKQKGARKPAEAIGAAFLAKAGSSFRLRDLQAALRKEGWSEGRGHLLISNWIDAGSVKRTDRGVYSSIARKAA
jgi:hypothetical protein